MFLPPSWLFSQRHCGICLCFENVYSWPRVSGRLTCTQNERWANRKSPKFGFRVLNYDDPIFNKIGLSKARLFITAEGKGACVPEYLQINMVQSIYIDMKKSSISSFLSLSSNVRWYSSKGNKLRGWERAWQSGSSSPLLLLSSSAQRWSVIKVPVLILNSRLNRRGGG